MTTSKSASMVDVRTQGRSNPLPGQALGTSESAFHAVFYSRAHPARELTVEDLSRLEPAEHDLLWVDLCAPDEQSLRRVADAVKLPAGLADFALRTSDAPELLNLGSPFGVRAQVAGFAPPLRFFTTPLTILCGTNVVVTIAPEPLGNVADLRERQQQNSELGSLSAQSFTASLLDGQLVTYYDAMSQLEAEVDQLEIKLLSSHQRDCLGLLRSLRKAASQLRRALSAHRPLFGGLARPEFRPNQDRVVDAHFTALESRYERAMDLAEHGRELVVGTFELFTTRAAMSTNETMKVLTFATVLIGGLAVIAGVFGMNFSADFFDSKHGFWTSVGAMAAVSVAAVWLAKRRDWL